jgi:hypothetical protein
MSSDVSGPSPAEARPTSARGGIVPYDPLTPMRANDRLRHLRVPPPLLGRPVPSPWRRDVLDDALLGAAWRWDTDDDRGAR